MSIEAAKELEQFLTSFNKLLKEANKQYQMALDAEALYNDEIQDILHTAELDPAALQGIDLISILHDNRENRREAKQYLEVTHLFKQWVDENQKAFNKLDNLIGAMRKVLAWQSLAFYKYKTDIITSRGSSLLRSDITEERPNSGQE